MRENSPSISTRVCEPSDQGPYSVTTILSYKRYDYYGWKGEKTDVFWARMTKGKASSFCHQENINIIRLRLQFQNIPRILEQSRRPIKHSSFVTGHELVTTFTWLYTQIAKIAEQRTTVPKGRTPPRLEWPKAERWEGDRGVKIVRRYVDLRAQCGE